MADQRLKDKDWRIDHLYKIRNKSGSLVQFKKNRAQSHYSKNCHTRNLILKSRQLGFTTFESIDSLDDVLFTPNIDALMIAHNLDAGESIFDKKIKLAWEKVPPELQSLYDVDSKTSKTLKFDFGVKGFSSIAVDTSGRSGTFRRVHITELAELAKKYPKKVPDILEGTVPAVPIDGRIDIECTSQGAGGDFNEMYMDALDFVRSNPNAILSPYQWKPHFYNWTWDDEEMAKIKEVIPFSSMEQGSKFEDYARKHSLTQLQITYYYNKWMSLNKKWNALKREYPTTPEEAFEAVSEGTWFGEQIGFMEANQQIGVYPWDRSLKVHTVWDLGVGKNLKVGFFQRDKGSGVVKMIDHEEGSASEGMPEMIHKINKKPYIYGKHFGPHDMAAVEIGTGKTRIESARTLGTVFTLVPQQSVEDGINGVSLWLNRLYVNKETCKKWIKSMKSYSREWDEKRGMYKNEPLHDWASHDADMSRYASLSEKQMTNDEYHRQGGQFFDITDSIYNA